MARPWLLPVVTGAVGLLGGFLTWKFAPETAGIGTNAAIRAFHQSEKISFPTALFKLITSALTIGGGLTSGARGPSPRSVPPRARPSPTSSSSRPTNAILRWRRSSARASPPFSKRRWPGPRLRRDLLHGGLRGGSAGAGSHCFGHRLRHRRLGHRVSPIFSLPDGMTSSSTRFR